MKETTGFPGKIGELAIHSSQAIEGVSGILQKAGLPRPGSFRPAKAAFQNLPAMDSGRVPIMLSPDRNVFGVIHGFGTGQEGQSAAVRVDLWRTRTLERLRTFTFAAGDPATPGLGAVEGFCLLNSHQMALGTSTGQLVVLDIKSGRVVMNASLGPKVGALGSDGKRLAVSILPESGQPERGNRSLELRLYDLAGSGSELRLENERVIPGGKLPGFPTHIQFTPSGKELLILADDVSGWMKNAEILSLEEMTVKRVHQSLFHLSISFLSDQGNYLLGGTSGLSLRAPDHTELRGFPQNSREGRVGVHGSISPDGNQILIYGNGQVHELSEDTWVIRLRKLGLLLGIWHLDNLSAIVLIRHPESYDLALVDTITWDVQKTLSQPGRLERPRPQGLAFSPTGSLLVGDRTGAVQFFEKGLVEARVAQGDWGGIEEIAGRGEDGLFTIATSSHYLIHFHSHEGAFSRSYNPVDGKPVEPDSRRVHLLIPADEVVRSTFLVRDTLGVLFLDGRLIEADPVPSKAGSAPSACRFVQKAERERMIQGQAEGGNRGSSGSEGGFQSPPDSVRKFPADNLRVKWEIFSIPMPARAVAAVEMDGMAVFLLESGRLNIFDPKGFAAETLPDGKIKLTAAPDPLSVELGISGIPRGACRMSGRRLAAWTDDRIWIFTFGEGFAIASSFWKPITDARGMRHDPKTDRLAVVFPDYIGFFDRDLLECFRLYLVTGGGRLVHVLNPAARGHVPGGLGGQGSPGGEGNPGRGPTPGFFWSDTDIETLLEVVDDSGKVIDDPEIRHQFLEDHRSEFLVREATEAFDRFLTKLRPAGENPATVPLLLEA